MDGTSIANQSINILLMSSPGAPDIVSIVCLMHDTQSHLINSALTNLEKKSF